MKLSEQVSENLEYPNFSVNHKLSPILKWAGGKEQELKFIIPQLPAQRFENFYEPFVGGGSVFAALQADHYFINDKSHELINLYEHIAHGNRTQFFKFLYEIDENWNLISSIVYQNQDYFIELYQKFKLDEITSDEMKLLFERWLKGIQAEFEIMFQADWDPNNFIREIQKNFIRKVRRMKQIELSKSDLPEKDILDNIETAFKSAFYMHFRHIYNEFKKYKVDEAYQAAIFLFIRNFAFSGMFRYNSKGKFNVPYGGIGYNSKNFRKKIKYLESEELSNRFQKTTISNLDFLDFFQKYSPQNNDFVFLDPPYDSEFSTYAQNEFNREDQERLADYLINQCQAKWMMIIKNTDFIYNLYRNKSLKIQTFDKKYLVSFMNRNDKNVTHLMITNY